MSDLVTLIRELEETRREMEHAYADYSRLNYDWLARCISVVSRAEAALEKVEAMSDTDWPPDGTRVIQCPHCQECLQFCTEGRNYPCERCGILWRFVQGWDIEVIDEPTGGDSVKRRPIIYELRIRGSGDHDTAGHTAEEVAEAVRKEIQRQIEHDIPLRRRPQIYLQARAMTKKEREDYGFI